MAGESNIDGNNALIADISRQADASIRGYYYQVLHSALAWVRLEGNQTLYLEAAEDFDVVANNQAITTQIKDTAGSGNITLRSAAVVEAINNYLAHKKRNPDKDILFRYLTTSAIGQEEGTTFGNDVKGIELWTRANTADAQKIKDFLLIDGKVGADAVTFLQNADAQNVLEKLIRPIRFYTKSDTVTDTRKELESHLVIHGDGKGVDALDAIRITGNLIEKLFQLISTKKTSLRFSDFLLFFDEETSVKISYQRHKKLIAFEQGQTNEFRSSGDTSSQSFKVDESAGPHDAELKEIKVLIDAFDTNKALEQLAQLRRDIFSSTTDKTRHRILIYTGICYFRHNQLDEGSKLFLEALPYAANQALALANAALGAGNLGRHTEAEEYLLKAATLDPNEPYIYSVHINIAPKETPLDELIAKVPIALKGAEKINFALGYAALNRNQIDQAVHYFELALAISKDDIETRGALGSALLEQLFNKKDRLITEQLDAHTAQTLERIIDLLQGAWDAISKSDQASVRYHWPMNLAQAYRQLGREENAVRCIDQVLVMRPNDSDVHKLKAMICYDVKDVSGAITHTLLVDEIHAPEKPLLLAQYYQENKEPKLALASLQEALAKTKSSDIRINAYSLSMHILSRGGDTAGAKEIIEKGIAEYPASNLLKINSAKLAYVNGDNAAAQKTINAVLADVVANGSIVERVELGDLCLDIESYNQAIQVYESFVDRRADSPFLRRLIGSYVEAEQADKALELIANARRYFTPTEFYAEIEGKVYEDTPDLKKAEAVYDAFLESNPDNFRIGLRRAFLMYRLDKLEEIDGFLERHKSQILSDFESMRATASLYLARTQMPRALSIMYEARRRFYDNPKAHMNYIGLILMHDDGSSSGMLDAKEIAVGTVVRLNDGAQNKWLHIVEDAEQDLSTRRYGVSHDLVKRLLGKQVGWKFELEGTVPPTKITVEEVKTKYLYALHESMELYSELFPGDKSLIRVDMGPMIPGQLPEGLKTMLDDINRNHDHVETNLDSYSKRQSSIYSLARILRKNPIETCYSMIWTKGMGIKCCLGGHEEREEAKKILLSKNAPIVLDLSSIITFTELGLLDCLKSAYPNLYVCQTTVEEFKQYAAEKEHETRKGGGMIGKADEGYYIQTISTESAQQFQDKLLNTVHWLEKNCAVAIPTQKLTPEGRKYVNFEFVLGRSTADTVISAASHGLVLLSDDLLLRHIALETAGVKGVWSQAVLMQILDKRHISGTEYIAAVQWLILSGYDFTTFNKFSMMWCIDHSDWQITDKFQAMLNVLTQPNSEVASSLKVSFDFLIEAWTSNRSKYDKQRVTYAVFNAFFYIPSVGWNHLKALLSLCIKSAPYQNIIGINTAIQDWLIGHFMWT